MLAKSCLVWLLPLSLFAEDAKPPQFTPEQKLVISQSMNRAMVAESQARQALDQARVEADRHSSLLKQLLESIKACDGATVDIQQNIACPKKEK